MQSRSILFLGIVIALAVLSGALMAKKPVSYGLDVNGGLRQTYRMAVEKLTPEQKKEINRMQSDMVGILEKRAGGLLGATDVGISKKGEDSFIIELPGFKDVDRASELLSSTAKVTVYWAKNVSTDLFPSRRYSKAGETKVAYNKAGDTVSYVTFARTIGGKTIEPNDPAYAEVIKDWEPILSGEEVKDAKVQVVGTNYRPEFFFSDAGAAKLEAWSKKYYNKRENIAFVLDGKVLNIAPVKEGTVLSNEAFIDGNFPPEYVKTLTEQIKAGSLPVELELLSSEQVDPTIGKSALTQMELAGGISLGVVCLALIFYYAFPGVIATLAMVLYGLFTLAFLNVINATFSLAAIAAFILSMGMAIDANILVFERLKEELREGKPLERAVSLAFKRALTAIVDSNACTVLTCLVLYMFGTGAVRGFASTLGIGVFISFFTAFVVTRTLLQSAIQLGMGKNLKWYGLGKGWFKHSQEEHQGEKLLNIVGRSKFYFILSGILIVPGLIATLAGGMKFNVEFQGGYEGTFMNPQNVTAESILKGLDAKGFDGANVKFAEAGGKKIVYVTVKPVKGMSVGDPKAKSAIAEAAGLPLENASFSAIGPTIQKETVEHAVNGVLFSSLLIMLYLGFRFGTSVGGLKNGVRFGASAVIALVHDVLFVIGSAAIVGMLMHWEVSALFITAMLTVIGFSVHDTIIIFDRVRENLLRQQKGETFEHLCDKSVSQSVARSINTSFSALIPLLFLIAIGTPTPELKFMCVSMFLGISIGAYSSIFNATPILYVWNKSVMKRKGEGAGLMAEAAREIKLRAQLAAGGGIGAPPAGAAAPAAGTPPAGGAYGQVKRRSGAVEQSKQVIDEDQE